MERGGRMKEAERYSVTDRNVERDRKRNRIRHRRREVERERQVEVKNGKVRGGEREKQNER